MKVTTYLSFAVFAIQTLQTPAAGSACSSGIYAALAPLETYPPAVTYCKGQAGKSTVTTVVTAASALRRRAVAKTTSIKASKTTTSSSKSSTPAKSTTDTRAAAWSSLVQQAEGIVSTFCSCAGYPAVVTTTSTITPAPSLCTNGVSSGQPCRPSTLDFGQLNPAYCYSDCTTLGNNGQGCTSYTVDDTGECYVSIACCTEY